MSWAADASKVCVAANVLAQVARKGCPMYLLGGVRPRSGAEIQVVNRRAFGHTRVGTTRSYWCRFSDVRCAYVRITIYYSYTWGD